MAEEIAKLGIKVTTKGATSSTKKLSKLEKQSKKSEKQNEKLGKSFGALKGIIVAFAGSLAINKFVQTAGAFQSMAISLEVVTGSAEKASLAMEGITKFAKNTPFQVSEITDAFIKLKALGIAPTEENLRSFGDTSSAMGKSLNQMIEAVADAATGEFERLKEFGIKARSQGDEVSFTFQGVTKTVKKNSKEITEYLENIGKTKFAGAMSKQMDTINGKVSTLGDSFDNLIVKFSKAGGGTATTGALDLVISAVDTLSEGIELLPSIFFSAFGEIDKFFIKLKSGADSVFASFAVLWTKKDENVARFKEIEETKNAEIKAVEQTVQSFIDGEYQKREARKLTKKESGITTAGKEDPKEKKASVFEFDDEGSLDKLRERYKSEETLLREKYAKEQQLLRDKLKADKGFQAEHDRLMFASKKQQSADEVALAKETEQAKRNLQMVTMQQAATLTGTLATLMTSKNKEVFEIGKTAAIAQAIINTSTGATKALEQGGIYGALLAGAVVAAGAVQISNIKAQTFGGGGSVSAPSGSVPTIPTGGAGSAATPSERDTGAAGTTIIINGEWIGDENFAERVADAVRNGKDRDL